MFSFSSFSGAAATTGSKKDSISSDVGCFSILYAAVAPAVVVKEKAVLATLLPLLAESVVVPKVPATVPALEKPVNVNVNAVYWYIIFCNIKESEPVELFISILLSANLAST